MRFVLIAVTLFAMNHQQRIYDPSRFPWQKPTGIFQVHIVGPGGREAKDPQAWVQLQPFGDAGSAFEPVVVDNGNVKFDQSNSRTASRCGFMFVMQTEIWAEHMRTQMEWETISCLERPPTLRDGC